MLSDAGLEAARNLAETLRSADPEGPHQLRIALRRLRTALWLYRPLVRPEPTKMLSEAAKLFAQRVGAVRDADVLTLEIAPAAAEAMEPRIFETLQAFLDQHRTRTRDTFLSDGAAVSGSELLLAAHRYQLDRMWRPEREAGRRGRAQRAALDGSSRAVARRGLDRAWRKAAQWGERIEELSVEERHEMRKALKRLRYSVAFMKPLYSEKKAEGFLKQLRTLQNSFGYLNDVSSAESLRDLAETAPVRKRPALRAGAEAVLAHHQAAADAAWISAQQRWAALAKTPRFWRA